MKIGHGYDVHKLVSNRDLIIGGEHIDFHLGLDGHSDADVLIHAIMDAIIGALCLGDIGKLFPDTSAEFKNIDSQILLKRVNEKMKFTGYKIGNIDATIIAQQPKLRNHIDNMRKNIANCLETAIENINIKATTEENLGFTGNLEGISAHAVCILFKN